MLSRSTQPAAAPKTTGEGVRSATYRRFVVVSYPRSGTHLLRTSLESHPDVVCQAEFFNSDSPQLPYPLSTPTREILDAWIFPPFPATVKRAGFVLQAYHPRALKAFPGIRANPAWDDVWPRLAAMEGLLVIHLERRNLLRRHLSHCMSRQTGIWHSWDRRRVERISHLAPPPPEQVGNEPPRQSVEIDPDRLFEDFHEVECWRRFAAEALGSHPSLTVTYEELCGEYTEACRRVQRFLGVREIDLEPAVRKLESRPLRDVIRNFHQLEAAFRGTEWESFFEEEP